MNIPNPHSDEAGGEDRMLRMESILKQDVGSPAFAWADLEARLMARIDSAEKDGDLTELKADAPSDTGMFERIELSLMARIAEHTEYNQPIDDVIASPSPALEGQFVRMEHRLEERIQSLRGNEPWELAILASEHPAPALFENIEDALDASLQLAPEEDWEKLIRADEASLTMGRLETVEQNLFARIAASEKPLHLAPAGFSLTFAWLAQVTWTKATVLGLFLASIAMWSYRNFSDSFSPLNSVVYQTQGGLGNEAGSLPAGTSIPVSKAMVLASGAGNSMTLVNDRGFVELRNGAAVRLEKATRREVRYSYAPKGGSRATGKATFFVTKRKAKENFVVATPDYQIEVMGTYFQVHPDLEGRVATSVLEGKVHIQSDEVGDFYLTEGQSLVFDASTGKYLIRKGGPVIAREAIENLPEMQDLHDYQVLSITASVPQAELTIDGRYRGVTPLAILQAPGTHRLRLMKDGYLALDTLITIRKGELLPLALTLNAEAPIAMITPSVPRPMAKGHIHAGLGNDDSIITSTHAPSPLDVENVFRQAEAAQQSDWRLAIQLYQQVLNLAPPGLRREAALFSIATLRADHIGDGEGRNIIKQDFLDYLARYPNGSFTGESWLRLAELELAANPEKAIEYYLKVFERYPRHHRLAELQHRVGLIYLQQKRFDLAIDMFRQGLSNVLLDSKSEKRKLLQGLQRAFVAKGDVTSAEKIDSDILGLQ